MKTANLPNTDPCEQSVTPSCRKSIDLNKQHARLTDRQTDTLHKTVPELDHRGT
jgi:hypothetical protein